jgi:uncharacterized protein YutE (UPF0331/DUF86 family)
MPQRDPGVYLEDIGFRNILAHGYAELDHNNVYNIAIAHAPQLLRPVQHALQAFPDPPSPP